MILESNEVPIVVPIWHIGMDTVLPNAPPYYIRTGKKVTYNFGQPIDLTATMENIKQKEVDAVEARRLITEKIQHDMYVSIKMISN
jgi:monolysocardiolipin acyltransferase